jgi:hypothetical protein
VDYQEFTITSNTIRYIDIFEQKVKNKNGMLGMQGAALCKFVACKIHKYCIKTLLNVIHT